MTQPQAADSYDLYIEWDVATWCQALPFWVEKSSVPISGSRVLEIGGRDGGLSYWLAGLGASVVCSDLGGPSEKARALHKPHSGSNAIEHLDLDATAMAFDSEFDIVIFKSVLGGVGAATGADGQRAAMENMFRALRPGGCLLFAENLAGPGIVDQLRRRFVPWGRRWRYVSMTELRVWLTGFAHVDFHTFGTFALLGRTERQRRILAKVDRRLFDRVCPEGWRYVVAACARKPAVQQSVA
jgi:SAM-dependent methyltransferase